MEKNQTTALSLNAAYAFASELGLEREATEIRNMVIEWDSSYTSSLRRGYIVDLFEKHGVFEEFKARYWARGSTPAGETSNTSIIRMMSLPNQFIPDTTQPKGQRPLPLRRGVD
jgi:hypothetical protein